MRFEIALNILQNSYYSIQFLYIIYRYIYFRPYGPHQCSADEQDESNCYLQLPLMPHESMKLRVAIKRF
jgi:hypothetical protein